MIKPEKAVIHENVLDLLGKQFKFDHAKGVAEWIKNSVDAYSIEGYSDNEQVIVILLDLSRNNIITSLRVLDFVGITKNKIDSAFKYWFDPNAAKKSGELTKEDIKTLGGHGNGGKFYMREMFSKSHIIGYRDEKINMFGFNEKKQYGYNDSYIDKKVSIDTAMEIAELSEYKHLLKSDEIRRIFQKRKRFTVVEGISLKSSNKTNYINKLIDNLIIHPQARRIIQRKLVFLITNPDDKPTRMRTPEIIPKRGFEKPIIFDCPENLIFDGEQQRMIRDNLNEIVQLKIFTSENPLKGHKYRGMNSIDILGDVGVIANYDINELGFFDTYTYSEFIYGECSAAIMEDEDYVTNDRSKLTDGPKKQALLNWIKDCIESVCRKMDEELKKEQKRLNLKRTSNFNELLNKWKNRFMSKIIKEQLAGFGKFGIDGYGEIELRSPKKRSEPRSDKPKATGQSGGSEKRSAGSFPKVLISGMDPDPFSINGESFYCDARHPAIYQRRPIDVKNGIYWINTSKPLAEKILEKDGAESKRWRDYLFQRYVDIIVKETIYNLGKLEVTLSADDISREIDNIISNVHDAAVNDLDNFLFQSKYEM
jgi:hypothetical protein